MFIKSLNKLIHKTPINSHANLRQFRRLISASVENDKFVVIQPDQSSSAAASSPSATTSVEPLKFPSVWLRDNCCCTQCFHPTSKSRKHDWDKFDVNVRVEKLQVSEFPKITQMNS